MRRLFLERSRWLSPRGSLLKKERGTFIWWRMSRHPVVPPLYSPVRSVAERRGAACCVVCGCGGGVHALRWAEDGAILRAQRLPLLRRVPLSTNRRSPRGPALRPSPHSLFARPSALLAVSPQEPLFCENSFVNSVSTRWAGIIQETDNLSINLIKVFDYIIIQVSTWLLTLFISLVVCIRNA